MMLPPSFQLTIRCSPSLVRILLLCSFLIFASQAQSDLSAPLYRLDDSATGAILQVGNVVQVFEGMSAEEVKTELLSLPLKVIMYSYINQIPTYFLFLLSPLVKYKPGLAPIANDCSINLSRLIQYNFLMMTLRSAYQLVQYQASETINSSKDSIYQWYQWAQCGSRIGRYPVYILSPGLAQLFHLQVHLPEDETPYLEISRLGQPAHSTPKHWQLLSDAMEKRDIDRLTISITEKNQLVLRSEDKELKAISLPETQYPWDIHLMGQWCSHTHSAFHSIFHPEIILSAAAILTDNNITSIDLPDPVQEDDESLLQNTSVAQYTMTQDGHSARIIWSDEADLSNQPGFLVWSEDSENIRWQFDVANSPDAMIQFQQASYQQSWSRITISLINMVISGLLSARVELEHKALLSPIEDILLILPEQPSIPSTTSIMPAAPPPPQPSIITDLVRQTARTLLQPVHDEMRRGPGTIRHYSPGTNHLFRLLMPLHMLGPMYMINEDDVFLPPRSGSASAPAKEKLKKTASEQQLVRKAGSWSKRRTNSARSLDSSSSGRRSRSLKNFLRKASSLSLRSKSSVSSDNPSSPRSSSSLQVSSDASSVSLNSPIQVLELMGFDDDDIQNLQRWFASGFAHEPLPSPDILREYSQTSSHFLALIQEEFVLAAERLPEITSGASLEAIENLQNKLRLDALIDEIPLLIEKLQHLSQFLEKAEFIGLDILFEEVPVHEHWLDLMIQAKDISMEATTPPASIHRKSIPPFQPVNSGSVAELQQSISDFLHVVSQLKIFIQESLRNPLFADQKLVNPLWFDICISFEEETQSLLLELADLKPTSEFYHVDLARVSSNIQRMQQHLESTRQLSSDRLHRRNPDLAFSIGYDVSQPDNHLLRRILLGDQSVFWPDAPLEQLILLSHQLIADNESIKSMVEQAKVGLAKKKHFPVFFRQHLSSRYSGQSEVVCFDCERKMNEALLWLDQGHKTTHARIITPKELVKGEPVIDVQVDIYEPILGRIGWLYHSMIKVCGEWRSGCPPMEDLLPTATAWYLSELTKEAHAWLQLLTYIENKITARDRQSTMGYRYKLLLTTKKKIEAFITQSHLLQNILTSGHVTGYEHPQFSGAIDLATSLTAIEVQFNRLGFSEALKENAIKALEEDALFMSPPLHAKAQRLISTSPSDLQLMAIPYTEALTLTEEILRLTKASIEFPSVILDQDQMELLIWTSHTLRSAISLLKKGKLRTTYTMLSETGDVPFNTNWSGYQDETVVSFVLQRYQELSDNFSWFGKPSAPLETSLLTARSAARPTLLLDSAVAEQKPKLEKGIAFINTQTQLWNYLKKYIVRQSNELNSPTGSHWLENYPPPQGIFPDEHHQLPYSSEVNVLWKGHTGEITEQSMEAELDYELPATMIRPQQKPKNTAVQVFLPSSKNPFDHFSDRVLKARNRDTTPGSGVNLLALNQSWKITRNTPAPPDSGVGPVVVDVTTDPLLNPDWVPPLPPLPPGRQLVQCDTLGHQCLDQRFQLVHFDTQFASKLATHALTLVGAPETQMKSMHASLAIMDGRNVASIKKVLTQVKELKKTLRDFWQTPMPTLESLLPRAPTKTSAK